MKTAVFPILILSALVSLAGCKETATPADPGPRPATSIGPVEKPVIYQIMTRLFSNKETANKPYGTIHENGCGKFEGITDQALAGIKELGVTHIWYTGVIEHATMTAFPDADIQPDDADVVKGRAGSPYAIKDYYDVTPLLAVDPRNRMAEFKQLLERTHKAGLAAIIDFVPNHVARNYRSDARPDHVADLGETDDPSQAFSTTNNYYYLPGTKFQVPKTYNPLGAEKAPNEDGQYPESPARATGNNVFSATPAEWDWFETIKLNYGVEGKDGREIMHFDTIPETWTKMRDILLFWAGLGVDGFRCDMAEMVPVEFWAWVIPAVKEKYPAIRFIAEIYNPQKYHAYVEQGKFDYLYDKVGTYDAVRELMTGNGSVSKIDSALKQVQGIEGKMLRFLENHDEQRIASKYFAADPWTAVPGMTLSATLGTGPVMIYFGQEVGEPGAGAEGFQNDDGRTTIFDFWGVPEHQKWMNDGKFDGGGLSPDQKKLRAFYAQLLSLVRSNPALRTGKFLPLPSPHEKVYAFLRQKDKEAVLVIVNFDRTAPQQAAVVIPPATMEAMGMPVLGPYSFEDLLGSGQKHTLDAKLLTTSGLSLQLPINAAFLFSLTPR